MVLILIYLSNYASSMVLLLSHKISYKVLMPYDEQTYECGEVHYVYQLFLHFWLIKCFSKNYFPRVGVLPTGISPQTIIYFISHILCHAIGSIFKNLILHLTFGVETKYLNFSWLDILSQNQDSPCQNFTVNNINAQF